MMKSREDSEIIRHIYKEKGLAVARAVQSLPCVVMPDRMFPPDGETFTPNLSHMYKPHMPWGVANYGIPSDSREMAWCTLTVSDEDIPGPGIVGPNGKKYTKGTRYGGTFWAGGQSLTFQAFAVGVFRSKGGIFTVAATCPQCGACSTDMSLKKCCAATIGSAKILLQWDIALLVSYLQQRIDYRVEVKNQLTRQQRRLSDRTAEKRPWDDKSLSSFIFIEPGKTHEYGRHQEPIGAHASPEPHHRRGHWHTLRARRFKRNSDGSPRRVWVRPAWVGDREWVHHGSTYKVVDDD